MIIFSNFTDNCLPLLIKQDYEKKPQLIHGLFTGNSNQNVIAITDKIDLFITYFQHLSGSSFDQILSLSKCTLTLDQMDKLSKRLPTLWKDKDFISLYLSKLMPSRLSFCLSLAQNLNSSS